MELVLQIRSAPLLTALTTLALLLVAAWPAQAVATRVDDRDPEALQVSASKAFYRYLDAIDREQVQEANDQVLDPGDDEGRSEVVDKLIDFMRARQNNPVRNEAAVVRCSGDWAMVVYQYDTTIAGKTARVITTAWMVQWEGLWKQFIVAPIDEAFWDTRRSDYELLQKWFDEHAEDLTMPM